MVEANPINNVQFMMTDPTHEDYAKTIFRLNKGNKQGTQLSNDEFDFRSHSTIQDGNDLYAISYRGCVCYKFTNITGGRAVVKTKIFNLNKKRGFHTSTLIDRAGIYLIGGNDGPRRFPSVYYLDLGTKQVSDGPELNQARSGHSVGYLNGVLYVVGGFDGQNWLDTIERLNIGAGERSWNIFTVPGFTARSYPLVCALNENELLIAGGYDGTEQKTDILELDPMNKSADVLPAPAALSFECYNQAI